MDERRSKISLRREDSDDSIEEKSGIRVFSTKRFDQVKESDTKKEYPSKPTKSQPKEDPRQNNPSHEKNSEKINENVTTESLPHLDGISVNTDLIPENIKFSKIEERRDDCDSSKLFRPNRKPCVIFRRFYNCYTDKTLALIYQTLLVRECEFFIWIHIAEKSKLLKSSFMLHKLCMRI